MKLRGLDTIDEEHLNMEVRNCVNSKYALQPTACTTTILVPCSPPNPELNIPCGPRDGLYQAKDWDLGGKDYESNGAITRALKNQGPKQPSGSSGALRSLFSRLTRSKALTEQDLKPVPEGMKQHLMKKYVAMEIADKVCEGVGGGGVLWGRKLEVSKVCRVLHLYVPCFDAVLATSNPVRTVIVVHTYSDARDVNKRVIVNQD
ncbi:hypothetical protein DEU56DRAFT_927413 [Suillus clintonianus]|uniref:uncharacterized protein n=1 Tax=Suillus clintonianus TaxID=1904413 RepID=UPI001B864B39|nr:uncharacterized protein DEU56DRAFT_927413 [Suillus clintonianus]KAG2121492.1 hypothetical protein DEU56DRAFT_927413 [Suillus clintonianus]